MKPSDKDLALLFLVRKELGNWQEAETEIGAEMLAQFETSGYLNHVADKWQISPKGKIQALRFVFSCNCF